MSETRSTTVTPVVYRVEEAAQALRVSHTTIFNLIDSGQLRTIQIGSQRLIPIIAVSEYITTVLNNASTTSI